MATTSFDPDEFVDSSDSEWLKRVHPDDRARIQEITRKQNSGEIERNAFEKLMSILALTWV